MTFDEEGERTLELAAGYAAAGQFQEAERLAGKVRNVTPLPEAWYFSELAREFLSKGDVTRALRVVDLLPRSDPGHESVMADVLGHLARAGHYERAMPLAVELTDDWCRTKACREVVEAMAASRKMTGLAAWIDSLRSPSERAMLNVTVAEKLLSRP
jgi:hypothetical protein